LAPAPAPLKEATPDAALQLLGLLQRDARLIGTSRPGRNHDVGVGQLAQLLNRRLIVAAHDDGRA